MQVGFSLSLSYLLQEDRGRRIAEHVKAFDLFRLELRQRSVDPWIEYRVLDGLNRFKQDFRGRVGALRRGLALFKERGLEISLWTHELELPRNVLEVYPNLATPRGDINLARPEVAEFVRDKYERFFAAVPEVDALNLTLTETAFPVAHRFDSEWTPEECLRWVIRAVHEACTRCGKRLIVRPFSAIREDYDNTRRALLSLPEDIEIMLKCDPYDWDPFLGMNQALATYAPQRVTVEFDLGNEYFGDNQVPVLYLDYLRERVDHARKLGIGRVVGRVDHAAPLPFETEGRLNVAFFHAWARSPGAEAGSLAARLAAEQLGAKDGPEIARLLGDAWEAYKKMFYIDGNLFFHTPVGDLEHAQRCLAFELVRPGQSLSHAGGEWHILSHRTTPDIDAVRAEKDAAVSMAERVLERLEKMAPGSALVERAENLVLMAHLYRALVLAFQAYVVDISDARKGDGFRKSLGELRAAAERVEQKRSSDWFARAAQRARALADEMERAFALERGVYRDRPGLAPDQVAHLEDMVAVGCPGEGHRISKYTHGSTARTDGQRCWRSVGRHLQYTLSASAGQKMLWVRAAGDGRLTVLQDRKVVARHEWSHGEKWSALGVEFESAGGAIDVRFDRIADAAPRVGTIYLVRAPKK